MKKFLSMTGNIKIGTDEVVMNLKKKKHLPALLAAMEQYKNMRINIFGKRKFTILGDSTS